jgi:GR25 family glycosyltransferase involved in LPS biosynthesis
MATKLLHLQITTDNETGFNRRARNLVSWQKVDLPPDYVHTVNNYVGFNFLDVKADNKLRGILGCLMTHRAAWEKFLKSGIEWVLITEDDCVPDSNLSQEIFNIEALFSEHDITKPTIIQLAHFVTPVLTLSRLVACISHMIFFRGKVKDAYVTHLSYGTHCYLLNRPMAEFFLKHLTGSLIPIDDQMIAASKNPLYSDLFFLRRLKSLANQDLFESAIDQSNVTYSNTKNSKWQVKNMILSIAEAQCNRVNLKDLFV